MLTIIVLVVYFFPTLQAISAHKKNWPAIAILNFFLGWTFIGWVVALTWAAKKD
jgi:hypothetical protein